MPSPAAPQRGSGFTISVAVILIIVAAIFGTRSFLEITADEPVSMLDVGPVTGALASHSERTPPAAEAPAAPARPAFDTESAPLVAANQPPPMEPAVPVKSAEALSQSNVPQVVPWSVPATTQILSGNAPAWASFPVRTLRASTSLSVIMPQQEQSAAYVAAARAATSAESDPVLLDEVSTLERRGDEFMVGKRTEDALDLYHTALVSAEEYAGRKSANPNARDQVVKLLKKLGTLELQNASTAEARATYLQARRDLLQCKSQGQWSRERAKALDEIESRILSLPRD
jgi:hypothetical protein